MTDRLTSTDPEPVEGTVIVDASGRKWVRDDGPYGGPGWRNWVRYENPDHDPESWIRVAGEGGPVVVISEADA